MDFQGAHAGDVSRRQELIALWVGGLQFGIGGVAFVSEVPSLVNPTIDHCSIRERLVLCAGHVPEAASAVTYDNYN